MERDPFLVDRAEERTRTAEVSVARNHGNECDIPDAVVEAARYPLSDDVPRLVRLDKRLVPINVRDIRESLPFHCYT